MSGTATVELYATVTIPGHESDGLVGTETVDITTNVSRFDPFLIDDPYVLGLDIPSEIELRFDPASGTGLAFVIEMRFNMLPTYEGKCVGIDQTAGTAQYTMHVQPIGDLGYNFAAELVSPVGRNRLGEALLGLDFSELGDEIDMGTYSVEDGAPLDGPGPCEG